MNLAIFNGLLLLTMFLMGIYVVKEDLRVKRIPNKLIGLALLAGGILYGLVLITGTIESTHFFKVLLNAGIAFLISFIIWKLRLWPAGDAKLFIAFSFLMPFYFYSQTYFKYFPSFALLINTFCVYLFFIASRFLFWLIDTSFRLYQRGHFKRKFLLRYVREKRRVLWAALRSRAVLINLFRRVLSKVFMLSVVAVFVTRRSFQFKAFSIYFLVFLSLRILLKAFIDSSTRKRIRSSEVGAGMNLSEETLKQLRSDRDFFRTLDVLRAEGLTLQQAGFIRDHLAAKAIPVCYVYDTIPFSPFIIIGAVVTVLAKGSMLHLIRSMM